MLSSCSMIYFAHPSTTSHSTFFFPRSALTGPPPCLRATVDSHHHHLRTPIQCISSAATTHRSSLSKPISISSTRTAGPQRRRNSCSTARLALPSSATHATPDSNPMLPKHHRDPLVLLSTSNFIFSHRSTTLRSAGELQFRRRSASPSPHRCRAVSPQPSAPVAPH
jgi:hypothetical protein